MSGDRELMALELVRAISVGITAIINAVDRFNKDHSADIKEDRKRVLLQTLDICADMLDEIGDAEGRDMVRTLKSKFMHGPGPCKPHLRLVDPPA